MYIYASLRFQMFDMLLKNTCRVRVKRDSGKLKQCVEAIRALVGDRPRDGQEREPP